MDTGIFEYIELLRKLDDTVVNSDVLNSTSYSMRCQLCMRDQENTSRKFLLTKK